MQRYTAP